MYIATRFVCVGAKLCPTSIAFGPWYAKVGNLGLCSFSSLILGISLWSQADLLYRLNCHVDKQPTTFSL